MAYISKKRTTDGDKPIGSNLFGICSTAGDTAQKDVAMSDFDVLVSGVTIHVFFANKNTASNPTLKVGNTSAVAISCNGANKGKWESGSVISFTYNGTNWIQNDADTGGDGNVTYRLSKSGNTITLTGSDGSTTSVTDSNTDTNTTYGISVTGGKVGVVAGGTTATKQYLHVSYKTVNVTVASKGRGEGYLNVAESGYTAVAVAGWNLSNQSGHTGVSYVFPFSMMISDNKLRYQLSNTSNSTRYVTLAVRIMYIPS